MWSFVSKKKIVDYIVQYNAAIFIVSTRFSFDCMNCNAPLHAVATRLQLHP